MTRLVHAQRQDQSNRGLTIEDTTSLLEVLVDILARVYDNIGGEAHPSSGVEFVLGSRNQAVLDQLSKVVIREAQADEPSIGDTGEGTLVDGVENVDYIGGDAANGHAGELDIWSVICVELSSPLGSKRTTTVSPHLDLCLGGDTSGRARFKSSANTVKSCLAGLNTGNEGGVGSLPIWRADDPALVESGGNQCGLDGSGSTVGDVRFGLKGVGWGTVDLTAGVLSDLIRDNLVVVGIVGDHNSCDCDLWVTDGVGGPVQELVCCLQVERDGLEERESTGHFASSQDVSRLGGLISLGWEVERVIRRRNWCSSVVEQPRESSAWKSGHNSSEGDERDVDGRRSHNGRAR